MIRIIDSTRQSMGWDNPWQTRSEKQIKKIAIHHSATVTGSRQAFENHWRRLGWRNGGYSEIIHRNGDVEICYVPTVVTNGVGGHNKKTYHICCIGNGSFTVAQEQSLLERIRFNMNRFNVPTRKVKGHNEFLGHRSNVCPGRNMNTLRSQLNAPVRPTPPATNSLTHTVRAGETLSRIASQHRTTVAELARLNNITNPNLIRTGQVLRLPNAATSNTNANSNIRVGSRVRVNANVRTWATGEQIANHVIGNTYTVQQVRTRNNVTEALLQGVNSWIRVADITPV